MRRNWRKGLRGCCRLPRTGEMCATAAPSCLPRGQEPSSRDSERQARKSSGLGGNCELGIEAVPKRKCRVCRKESSSRESFSNTECWWLSNKQGLTAFPDSLNSQSKYLARKSQIEACCMLRTGIFGRTGEEWGSPNL